ncbi:MAG: hypothetical protein KDF59_16450 [Nitrosomonas sp.]|nr:hypothetical protein [Nitrosomonas sp.]
MAKLNAAPRKTGIAMVHICPRISVVMGDVIDIGESVWRYRDVRQISRLRE